MIFEIKKVIKAVKLPITIQTLGTPKLWGPPSDPAVLESIWLTQKAV